MSTKPDAATRRRLLTLLPLAGLAPALWAQGSTPKELLADWPAAHLQGQGKLRFLGLQVYDIRLWTHEPGLSADAWQRRPLALEIEYARAFAGAWRCSCSGVRMILPMGVLGSVGRRAGPGKPLPFRAEAAEAIMPLCSEGLRELPPPMPGIRTLLYRHPGHHAVKSIA
jgi:hypothetical protein